MLKVTTFGSNSVSQCCCSQTFQLNHTIMCIPQWVSSGLKTFGQIWVAKLLLSQQFCLSWYFSKLAQRIRHEEKHHLMSQSHVYNPVLHSLCLRIVPYIYISIQILAPSLALDTCCVNILTGYKDRSSALTFDSSGWESHHFPRLRRRQTGSFIHKQIQQEIFQSQSLPVCSVLWSLCSGGEL